MRTGTSPVLSVVVVVAISSRLWSSIIPFVGVSPDSKARGLWLRHEMPQIYT